MEVKGPLESTTLWLIAEPRFMEVKGLWGINNIMIDHITHIYGSKRSLVESITLWFNPDLWNWKVFWGINNIMIDPITQIYGSEGCLWNQQHYDRSHNPDLWKWKVTWGINNNMIDPITQIYRSEGSLGNQHYDLSHNPDLWKWRVLGESTTIWLVSGNG